MANSLFPEKGEKALIAGQTGSGKTAFAVTLLQRIPETPFVIYDTKIEPKFNALSAKRIVHSLDELREGIDDPEIDFHIFRPSEEIISDKFALDELLWRHYRDFHHVGAYIDEITEFTQNGRAERGLNALLARGRSKGITLIMSTQRPVWLARNCITESRNFFIFDLIDRKDRKRFDDIAEDFSEMPRPQKHGFYFFRVGETERPILYGPIKLDGNINLGYTDELQETDAREHSPENPSAEIWI